MAYEQKEGDIAIFFEDKGLNDKGNQIPQWTGKALVDGKLREVSMWVKSDTMLAGQIKDKWVPNMDEAKQAIQNTSVPEDVSDEIPFDKVREW